MESHDENEVNGWETITRTRKYRKGCGNVDAIAHPGLAPIDSLNPPDKSMTLEDLKKSYATAASQWQASNSRRKLLEMLGSRQSFQYAPSWKLTNAMCLATGSFSRTNTTTNRRAMQQFATFHNICEWLSGINNQKLEILAQEPWFTDVDREFLKSLGVGVLEIGPQGSHDLGPAVMYITVDTFVFEPFLERKTNVLRPLYAARPRLYIGSSMHGLEEETFFQSGSASEGKMWKQSINSKSHITGYDVKQRCNDRKSGHDDVERIREMNMQAIRFISSRKPGKFFPKFDEGPQIFEGLRVYWDVEENDEN